MKASEFKKGALVRDKQGRVYCVQREHNMYDYGMILLKPVSPNNRWGFATQNYAVYIFCGALYPYSLPDPPEGGEWE